MKREEKTELTKERIIEAAMQEFGTHGYEATRLNAICSNHGVAKGLLYHNFEGKNELYLVCVSRCIAGATAYLQSQGEVDSLQKYTELRFRYFSENPLCARVFFEAILQPPPALACAIQERKKEFERLNRRIYRAALAKIKLRPGVSEKDAMAYYGLMQEMFNGYFSSPAYAGESLDTVVADHEGRLSQMLDFMVYGIAERGELK